MLEELNPTPAELVAVMFVLVAVMGLISEVYGLSTAYGAAIDRFASLALATIVASVLSVAYLAGRQRLAG